MLVCGVAAPVAAPRAIGAPGVVSEKGQSVGASGKETNVVERCYAAGYRDGFNGVGRVQSLANGSEGELAAYRQGVKEGKADALREFDAGVALAESDYPVPDGSASRPYPIDLGTERLRRLQEQNLRSDGNIFNLMWFARNGRPRLSH